MLLQTKLIADQSSASNQTICVQRMRIRVEAKLMTSNTIVFQELLLMSQE